MQLPRPAHHEDLFLGVIALIDALESRFKAVDADKLDGRDSTDFASAVASATSVKAKDADLLDGIDSLGFLKLLTAANRKLAFGGGVIALAAATTGNVNITHGLGVAPVRVFLQLNQGGAAWAYLASGTYGVTTFNVSCLANAAVTGNIPFDWLAIG